MRAAVIGPARMPIAPPFGGGLEVFCDRLTSGLRAAGVEVDLYAARGSRGHRADFELPSIDWTGYEREARDDAYPPGARAMEDAAYRRLLAHLHASGYDIIHNNSVSAAVFSAAPGPVPMLTTLHVPPQPPLDAVVASAGPSAGAFAAVSGFTAAQWAGLTGGAAAGGAGGFGSAAGGEAAGGAAAGGAGGAVGLGQPLTHLPRVIHNAVDTTAFTPGPGGRHAVWFGRITPEKGLHLAIDACRLAGLPLRIFGRRAAPQYFDEQIAPRLGPDARWLGHLNDAQLIAEVGAAAVTVVTPCWDEPFGLVTIESLACGTPVAAFARGGIPEVLAEMPEMLAAPDDVASLAAAIDRARRIDRTDARHLAVSRFDRSRMIAEYIELYAQLADRASATAELIS